MSSDPDNWYEDEYWEEIGRKEDIDNAIKNLSRQPIRDFLGTYGDAIDNRVDDVIAQARYARQGGYPRFAILGAVTAVELITRHMLIQPLLQGAFLSESGPKYSRSTSFSAASRLLSAICCLAS